jgi:hypothetical protein
MKRNVPIAQTTPDASFGTFFVTAAHPKPPIRAPWRYTSSIPCCRHRCCCGLDVLCSLTKPNINTKVLITWLLIPRDASQPAGWIAFSALASRWQVGLLSMSPCESWKLEISNPIPCLWIHWLYRDIYCTVPWTSAMWRNGLTWCLPAALNFGVQHVLFTDFGVSNVFPWPQLFVLDL